MDGWMFGWLGGWWLRLIYREKTTQGSLLLPLASPSIAAGGGGCTTKFNAICKMKSIQLIVDFDKHTSTSVCTTLAEPEPGAGPSSCNWKVVQATMVTGVWGWTCSYPCRPATHTYIHIHTRVCVHCTLLD